MPSGVNSALIKNDDETSEYMKSLQKQIEDLRMNNGDQHFSVSTRVMRRINALRCMQVNMIELESKMFDEIFKLECKYAEAFKPYYDLRNKIISGEHEPGEDECNCSIPLDDDAFIVVDDSVNEGGDAPNPPSEKGIPNFWLRVMKGSGPVAQLIREWDEPILEKLEDIRVSYVNENSKSEDEPGEKGFMLHFHFAPNEYFKNTVLTKFYEIKTLPAPANIFSFDGPEIVNCKGCDIEWFENKNVTCKTVSRKQRRKSTGAYRIVTKTVPVESFFNFFSPPPVTDETSDEIDAILDEHFEVGHFMREKMIPNAILFYTHEAGDFDSDDDFDDEEETDEDENASGNSNVDEDDSTEEEEVGNDPK